MALPAKVFHLHHSVTLADVDADRDGTLEPHELRPTGDADADVRTVERIGGQRFGRMSYSWLIHPRAADTVFEGAGYTIGAHTGGYNSTSFGTCLVGNYHANRMTDEMVQTCAELYAMLVLHGHLVPDAPIVPHRARKATSCPGDDAVARIPAIRELAGWVIAGGKGAPKPPPAPVVTSPDQKAARAMDTLDLRNAHTTPVRGRHVDNLQGLLTAAALLPGLEEVNPGGIDGIGGSRTRSALITFQRAAAYFGRYRGAADGIAGEGTWHALITF
jgi:hypothetical protein